MNIQLFTNWNKTDEFILIEFSTNRKDEIVFITIAFLGFGLVIVY